MKNLLYSAILLLLFSCSTKVINFDQLQDRNGLFFLVNEEKPFSGEVVSYVNGKLEFDGEMKNGLREGVWNYYYPSGQKKMSGLFTDGLKEGTWTYWRENGSQDFIELYKLGKRLGNDSTSMAPMGTPDSTAGQTNQTGEKKSTPASAKAAVKEPEKKEPPKSKPVVWERLRGGAVKLLDGIPYTGPVVKYYREGGKELDGSYTNGHRDGKWIFYDRYGNIKDVRYY